jgi:hypothetical protein
MFDRLIREHYERAAQGPAGRFYFDGVPHLERLDEVEVKNYVQELLREYYVLTGVKSYRTKTHSRKAATGIFLPVLFHLLADRRLIYRHSA